MGSLVAGLTRIASSIDLGQPIALQKAKSTVAALPRPVQFTEAQVADSKTLVKQLHAMQLEIAQTSHAVRAHPEQAPVTFRNVPCGVSGAKVTLRHGFGVYADFIVVNWKSTVLPAAATATGPSLVSDVEEAVATRGTDSNTLVLNSYVAGVATIRVFPGG